MLFPASTVTGCFSMSVFVSLDAIPVGITRYAVGIEIYAITAGINKYKPIFVFKRAVVAEPLISGMLFWIFPVFFQKFFLLVSYWFVWIKAESSEIFFSKRFVSIFSVLYTVDFTILYSLHHLIFSNL